MTQGFTKIEILIIASIIGILGLTSVFSVLTARSRTRDAVRMSDVRQLQAGLEMYFIDFNSYPDSAQYMALGTPSAHCLSESGFSGNCQTGVYLEYVPSTPSSGLEGLSSCSDEKNAYCYMAQGKEYRLQFELEHKNEQIGLSEGINCATETGIKAGACDSLILSTQE